MRFLRVGARDVERRAGVSMAQLFVLERLAEGPAASLAELALRTATDASSVSVVVARLARRGLVKRRKALVDARRSEITLSARGAAVLRTAPTPAQDDLLRAIARLPPTTRAALERGLLALARELGVEHGVPPLFFEDERTARR